MSVFRFFLFIDILNGPAINGKTNNVYYKPVIYKGKKSQILYDMAVPYNHLERYSIKTIWENATHLQINFSASELADDKNKLRDILLYYSELLKYWNRLNRGNFFITSNSAIFDNINFAFKQLQKYEKYNINKDILPDNTIIVGAKGMTSFDNPIIASPFIDSDEYKKFLFDNKLSDFYQIDFGKRFPIMEKMNHIYDNYQKYINENVPQKWHIEKFDNCKLYYIVLHLR